MLAAIGDGGSGEVARVVELLLLDCSGGAGIDDDVY